MNSKSKSGRIAVLVDQYTRRLKKYLKTGKGKPDPNSFLDKCTKKTDRRELRLHLNMTTLLTIYGAGLHREVQKTFKKRAF
jgi:hypothetical protein